MSQSDRIRISEDDLFSDTVEEYLDSQDNLRREIHDAEPRPLLVRVLFSSWFYLSVASGVGAFLAWAALEPFFTDNPFERQNKAAELLLFPTVVGLIGLFLGAAEGLMCRNLRRATLSGLIGLGIGFAGGFVAILPANMLFGMMARWAHEVSDPPPFAMPTGFGLLLLMMGRAAGWALAGLPAGLGQGVALREPKVIVNGVVGGVLGGLLGGLAFDPVAILFADEGEAWASRMVGFVSIGCLVGLFVGLVEGWTKTAWLLMRQGPLAGKQFVLFKDTTTLGSSPRADVYLFKDEAIEPEHAIIRNRGGRFEIEDLDTPDGTYVNGEPIDRRVLQSGDQIVLGRTVLEFDLRER